MMILGLIPTATRVRVGRRQRRRRRGTKIALLNRRKRDEAARYAREVTYVRTAIDPEFQNEFVGAIHIPHASDDFPHLAHILVDPRPHTAPAGNDDKRSQRAERIRARQSRAGAT